MTHRDRVGGSSGRRKVAGDAVHRQNFSTPPDGSHHYLRPSPIENGDIHAVYTPSSKDRPNPANDLKRTMNIQM